MNTTDTKKLKKQIKGITYNIPKPKYKIGDIVIIDINVVGDSLESFKPYGLLEETEKEWARNQTIAVQLKIKTASCCDFTIQNDLFVTIDSDKYESNDAQWMYGFEYDGADNLEMVCEDQIIWVHNRGSE